MALTKVANTLLDFTGGFVAGNVSFPAITTVGDTNTGIYFPAADTIAFADGGVESARIDSVGNFGLGFTPSVQYSGIKSLQIGSTTNLFDQGVSTKLYHNAYTAASGDDTHLINGYAQAYLMPSNGNHIWYISTSGTAGNTVSFTQAMTLTAAGDLVVGASATRGTYKLDIRSDTSIAIGSNATYFGTIGYSAGTGYLSLASEAGGGAGIKCLNGTTTLSIIDLNSLYVYVGVNPSSNGVASARIFNSSAGGSTTTLYIGNQSITTSSDVRLKENIVDTQRNALELLGQLRVVDHTWNDPSDQCENNRNSRGTWMGLIAQEAQPVIPWLVNKPTADVDENGDPQYWHMDYGYSVPLLVKAIQEQQALITQLQADVAALKGA